MLDHVCVERGYLIYAPMDPPFIRGPELGDLLKSQGKTQGVKVNGGHPFLMHGAACHQLVSWVRARCV